MEIITITDQDQTVEDGIWSVATEIFNKEFIQQ